MFFIGIDLGTTNIKGCLFDANSQTVVASKSYSTLLVSKNDLSIHEVYPNQLWKIVQTLISDLATNVRGSELQGIAISSQMHGFLAVDDEGRALTPFYGWQDKRASHHLSRISAETNLTRLRPGHTVCLWDYLNQTKSLPSKYHLTLLGDFIVSQLAEKPIVPMHISNAHSTGLLEFVQQEQAWRWNRKAVDSLKLDARCLPPLAESLTRLPAKSTLPGIGVFLAMGDQQATLAGMGTTATATPWLNVGTGAQISCIQDQNASLNWTSNLYEIRPYFQHKVLVSVAGLPGGTLLQKKGLTPFKGEYRAAYLNLPNLRDNEHSPFLASGNVLRRSPTLTDAFEKLFGRKLSFSNFAYEAPVGAVLSVLVEGRDSV